VKKLCALLLFMLFAVAPAAAAQDDQTLAGGPDMREAPPSGESFELVEIVSGLRNPLYATGAGDGSGRVFVMEQPGIIWLLVDDVFQNTPFLDVSRLVSQDVMSGYSERGLLGLAFHPEFAENGRFYINYTDIDENNTHIAEYQIFPDFPNEADLFSGRIVMVVGQPDDRHNGGNLVFGPDGYLYISFGDGKAPDDPLNNGQNPGNILGTIARIDVDSYTETRGYSIPPGNPWETNPAFAPEVWHYGLRNPWRFSFDSLTGDLYIGDVGQSLWEEINYVPAGVSGLNFGWRLYEGTERYVGAESDGVELTSPVLTYSHSEGECSITGGYVYRGEAIPDLQGVYVYSDYCTGRIWGAYRDLDGAWQSTLLMETGRQVSSFGLDDSGELLVVDYGGSVLRVVPAG
jgi:glucose/arabinose dehydrogenase